MRPTILATGLALSIAFLGVGPAGAQRPGPEDVKAQFEGLKEDAIRLHATILTLQQQFGRNPAFKEKIAAAIIRGTQRWSADYRSAVDRAKAVGVVPPKQLQRWLTVLARDSTSGYWALIEARRARERRESLLPPAAPQKPRDDYYPDAVPPDLPWPKDGPRNPGLEEMRTLLDLLAGLPGGRCAGSVLGAEARKLDPDPNVVAAMLRECIGGNGSASRN
jgi:hypothetical protein